MRRRSEGCLWRPLRSLSPDFRQAPASICWGRPPSVGYKAPTQGVRAEFGASATGPTVHFSSSCLGSPQWKNTGASLSEGEEEDVSEGLHDFEAAWMGRAVHCGHLRRLGGPASGRKVSPAFNRRRWAASLIGECDFHKRPIFRPQYYLTHQNETKI